MNEKIKLQKKVYPHYFIYITINRQILTVSMFRITRPVVKEERMRNWLLLVDQVDDKGHGLEENKVAFLNWFEEYGSLFYHHNLKNMYYIHSCVYRFHIKKLKR